MGKITASQSGNSSSYSRRNECRDTTGDDSMLYHSKLGDVIETNEELADSDDG